MQHFRRHSAVAALALSWAVASTSVRGDTFLDQIGITQLRSEAPFLTGNGVIVAQPEATNVDTGTGFDHDNFEVNPTSAGVAVPIVYVHKYPGAVDTTFNAALVSGHANTVASFLAGTSQGVAPGLSELVNLNAGYYELYVLQNVALSIENPSSPGTFWTPKIMNQSFTQDAGGPYTADVLNQAWDSFVSTQNVIVVTGAGNGGEVQIPATAYNVIAVGAYQGNSSVSTAGERAKPDIVVAMPDGYGFTSFSTPVVSGIAAILYQASGGSGNGVDPRTIKTLLLNSATKPSDWTHSSTVPLDRRYGAGLVNADNAYHQLLAGEHAASLTNLTTSVGGVHAAVGTNAVPLAGWRLGNLTSTGSSDAVDHYVLDLSASGVPSILTATLVWQRDKDDPLTNEIRSSGAGTTTFNSAVNTINNLDLYLYDANTQALVDQSVSTIDNVEHLYTLNLNPGTYDLQVLKNGGFAGSANVYSDGETYALAWNAISVTAASSVANYTNLTFSQSNAITVSAAISGVGSLLQTGTGTTTLTGTNTYGATTISAGVLQIGNGGGTGSLGAGQVVNNSVLTINRNTNLTLGNSFTGNGTLNHNGTGTTTLTGAYAGSGAMNVNAGKLVFDLTAGARHTPAVLLNVSNLTIATNATLDVTNHDMMIGNTTLATVESRILAGFGAASSAPAITSSTAKATGNMFLVPVLADTWLGNGTAGSSIGLVFDGTTVTQPNTVLVKFTFVGDLNLDGKVDGTDFGIANSHLGQSSPGIADISAAWLKGDVTLNGVIDALDLASMASNFGAGYPLGTSDPAFIPIGPSNSVPEPASLVMLGIGGMGLMLKRRRRS